MGENNKKLRKHGKKKREQRGEGRSMKTILLPWKALPEGGRNLKTEMENLKFSKETLSLNERDFWYQVVWC